MDLALSPAGRASRGRFATQVVAPALAAVMLMAGLTAALILVSTQQADRLASRREQRIMATVLAQSVKRVAHDQEGSTVWDDAVRQVRAAKLDLDWLDTNVGIWLNTYSEDDAVYVLNDIDRPIYAMRGGRRAAASSYDRDAIAAAGPLVTILRGKLRRPSPTDLAASPISPGAIDLGIVHGHPAIVSVKPFTSDTGLIRQVPGDEYLHVAVRYLDTGFVRDLASEYHIDGAAFATTRPAHGHSAVPLRSSTKRLLGYLVWRPFQPGWLMMRRLAPMMALSLVLVFVIVAVLLRNVRQGMLRLEASKAQAQHLAFHDPLTGLANRAMFEDRLASELACARARRTSLALLYLDLDGFKHVNDTLGHPAGDELICMVAARLAAHVRTTDLVARIGGDEFAIIQCGIDGAAAVEILCMRIVEEIGAAFDVAGTQARVGMSIGIAISPKHAIDSVELARKADIALYEAKTAGKGRYTFFADAMDASVRSCRQDEADGPVIGDTGAEILAHDDAPGARRHDHAKPSDGVAARP